MEDKADGIRLLKRWELKKLQLRGSTSSTNLGRETPQTQSQPGLGIKVGSEVAGHLTKGSPTTACRYLILVQLEKQCSIQKGSVLMAPLLNIYKKIEAPYIFYTLLWKTCKLPQGKREHYNKSLCTYLFTATVSSHASFFIFTRPGFLSCTLINTVG